MQKRASKFLDRRYIILPWWYVLGPQRQSNIPCRISSEDIKWSNSPDLNPIENVFHLIGKKLREDVEIRNLTKKIFMQFSKKNNPDYIDLSYCCGWEDHWIDAKTYKQCYQMSWTKNKVLIYKGSLLQPILLINSDAQLINKRVTNESPTSHHKNHHL